MSNKSIQCKLLRIRCATICALDEFFDEVEDHHSATNKFEYRASEQADERPHSCTKGTIEIGISRWLGSTILRLSSSSLRLRFRCLRVAIKIYQFAQYCAQEWTNNNAPRAHKQTNNQTYGTTPHSPFGTTKLLRSPCGNEIVKQLNHHHNDSPNGEELPWELHTVGEMQQEQAHVG